jgi:hypothetical protein
MKATATAAAAFGIWWSGLTRMQALLSLIQLSPLDASSVVVCRWLHAAGASVPSRERDRKSDAPALMKQPPRGCVVFSWGKKGRWKTDDTKTLQMMPAESSLRRMVQVRSYKLLFDDSFPVSVDTPFIKRAVPGQWWRARCWPCRWTWATAPSSSGWTASPTVLALRTGWLAQCIGRWLCTSPVKLYRLCLHQI